MQTNFSITAPKMNIQKTDSLNIAFIMISFLLAYWLPFGLFLFSYAVLGPLHYLTEINWLRQKNYFVKDTKWIWVLFALAGMASLLIFFKLNIFHLTYRRGAVSYQLNSGNLFNQVLLIAILFAAGLVFLNKQRHIVLLLIISALISFLLLKYASFSVRLFCIFLPTILHVYLFTLLFMIAGTINNKSKTGIIAVILLVLCPVFIFAGNINVANYPVTDFTRSAFMQSGLYKVNGYIGGLFTGNYSPFLSAAGIKAQIFIAFCYTYHYLNWFSKTSVIGWNKNISRSKLAAIIALWAGAVLLYLYNYRIGFTALFFLSTLHVMLEFPLNISSMRAILLKIKPKKTLLQLPGIKE